MKYAADGIGPGEPKSATPPRFTLGRLIVLAPLVAILIALPAATWSPADQVHVLVVQGALYTFPMALILLIITLVVATIRWVVSDDRGAALQTGIRCVASLFILTLACLTYLAYSYCIMLAYRHYH